MYINSKIDWITATKTYDSLGIKAPNNSVEADFVAVQLMRRFQTLGVGVEDKIAPRDGLYHYGYKLRDLTELWVSTYQTQGVKVVRTGRSMPVGQGDTLELYNAIKAENWRTTRVDFAFDFFESGYEIRDLWLKYIQSHYLNTKLTSDFHMSPNGDTIALGSRESDLYLRWYDKGAEQKDAKHWLRCEIEVKGKTARKLPQLANKAMQYAAGWCLKKSRSLPDDMWTALEQIKDGCKLPTIQSKPVRGTREKWLVEQIIPAIINEYETNIAGYDRFIDELTRQIEISQTRQKMV